MVEVKINGQVKLYEVGTSFESIAQEYQAEYDTNIVLVFENGKIRELLKTITRDCTIEFILDTDKIGHKTYVRSLTMLALKSIHDSLKNSISKCRVEFVIGNGYYIQLGRKITKEECLNIQNRMEQLIEAKLPINKTVYPIAQANEIFEKCGYKDKLNLFKFRRSSFINIYELDGYYDYYYGYMLPNTRYIKSFSLLEYEEGLMLIMPELQEDISFVPRTKLFQTLKESDDWGQRLGLQTIGDLNLQICKGGLNDMILVQEAEQERKIGEIAKDIHEHHGVKFVMIAGPSSSGKTTFSHRLSIQLRTQGYVPHPIGLDNYYVERHNIPMDEHGEKDFECLEAIDVEQFNQDMNALLQGKAVELPSYNFKTGKREYKGNVLKLGPNDILVIEGIHGLNSRMSYALPDESKYKIYISALTTLNVDEHNRIPTTDGRLIRRMVRDARTRDTKAAETIKMWASVRRGEEKYIFPFQEDVNAMFNSALIYELAVLKQFVEPLLFEIEESQPEYYEAKRLLKFLEYFLGVSSENVPNNSICREFLGGSCFDVK